ncbi:MAG: FKBP-type peptidyl-prolyl cis-trans isomerase [Oscillospiraceae bacterium]|nr:FKBP-type peptidyl-prolyl cis-trans isomerase [Oscillospiraceae bacterium]
MKNLRLFRAAKLLCLVLALVLPMTLLYGCTSVAYDENFTYADAIDENGFFRDLKASKYVTLPKYKGIPIPADTLVASEEDLQEQLDALLDENPVYEEITDRAVEDGDTINIDYVGSVDGVEFEGGSTNGNGTVVTIGVTSYIDDFLEQLIGHKPGENFDIEVTFPSSYPNSPELASKDAIFNITINYIQGEKLETEVDDEFAVSIGFENKDALIADISAWIVEQQKLDFFNGLIDQAECKKVPDTVVNYIVNSNLAYYKTYAEAYGITLEALVINAGYDSIDAYIDEMKAGCDETAAKYLAVQAIAELEGLTVTDEDIAAADMTDYVASYGIEYVKQYVLQYHVVPNWVADNAIPE